MAVYLKEFENHTQYENYINGSSAILPNVSICTTEGDVHYNPWVETRVVVKYNVTSTSSPTRIASLTNNFTNMEIDGVVQENVVSAYTFDTVGEHTVKCTLADPTSIGDYTFYYCTSLTSIDIPDSVTTIGSSSFYECSSLTSIDIPSGVTSIGSSVFNGCSSLTSIDIPNGVTSIGNNAFYYCSGLTSCTIGSGVTSIGESAFYQCTSLTSIDIPNSVRSIGDYAFAECSGFTSIDIPSGVTSIGDGAFSNCSDLTSCTIGSGVTSIGHYAFGSCTGLTSITSNRTTAPTIQSSTFQDVKTGGTLTVPAGSSGYDTWMQNANYYLGLYGWTKVEQ